MALNPALREMVAAATAKYDAELNTARGITPLQPIEIDPYDDLIYDVAEMISEALVGPAIGALELAEEIVDTVMERIG